jgi:hypothetical protein
MRQRWNRRQIRYCSRYPIVILGRQQLFTESTLTAVLPLMVRRDLVTFLAVLRMWGIVLAANLVGTIIFAAVISPEHIFADPVRQSLVEVGEEILAGPIGAKFLKAMLAGWLIALMVWLLPSARSARLFVIMLLTYVVAIGGGSPHYCRFGRCRLCGVFGTRDHRRLFSAVSTSHFIRKYDRWRGPCGVPESCPARSRTPGGHQKRLTNRTLIPTPCLRSQRSHHYALRKQFRCRAALEFVDIITGGQIGKKTRPLSCPQGRIGVNARPATLRP